MKVSSSISSYWHSLEAKNSTKIQYCIMMFFFVFLRVHKDSMNFAARKVTTLYQSTPGDVHIQGLTNSQMPHSSLAASGASLRGKISKRLYAMHNKCTSEKHFLSTKMVDSKESNHSEADIYSAVRSDVNDTTL